MEERGCGGLAERDAALGRRAAGLLLEGIEPGDALDRLLGDRRGLSSMDVDELAADVGLCQATSRMAPER